MYMIKYFSELFYSILYRFRNIRDYYGYFKLDLGRLIQRYNKFGKIKLFMLKEGFIKL